MQTTFQSPVGEISLTSYQGNLVQVVFLKTATRLVESSRVDLEDEMDQDVLNKAVKQFKDYFAGKRTDFDLPLAPKGTPFQQRVWDELRKIPYGETICYAEQAERLGDNKLARAVGQANGKNPLPIVIPCHRVIGKNGGLTGFSSGLEIKRQLLGLEKEILCSKP